MATMGHRPRNPIALHYIDPAVYPKVVEPASRVVHDYFFGGEGQPNEPSPAKRSVKRRRRG